jgi:hypothetical protein
MLLRLFLGLAVLWLGLYAGFLVLNPMGLFPALDRMRDASAVELWQALDTFMARRMPPFALGLMALQLGLGS